MGKRADKNSLSFDDFTDNILIQIDNKISVFVNEEQIYFISSKMK